MYKTVIFDLDGTILDTLNDLKTAVNHALNEHGFPKRTIDEVRNFVGNGIKNLIIRAVPQNTSEREILSVLETFKDYYGKNSAVETAPYDGIINCLEKLKNDGINIAVVTNKAHFAAVPLCKKYFGDLIDITIGEKENVSKKPDPDMVYEAMGYLGANKNECVYVGDSDVDIQTAKNSGMPCISVTWGFRGKEFLEKSGAEIIADTPEQLYGLITTKKMALSPLKKWHKILTFVS